MMSIKQILVIGGSSSIGLKLVKSLLNKNYRVIAHYRSDDDVLEKLRKKYSNHLRLIHADFLEEKSFNEFISFLDQADAIHSVVHLPSPPILIEPIFKIDWLTFEKHLSVQLKSLHSVISKCLKDMKKTGDAKIISIGSEAITSPHTPKGFTAYAVAKGALNQYLKSLKSEVEDYGVGVYQIIPGMFKSPLLNEIPNYVVEQTIGSTNLEESSVKKQNKIVNIIVSLLTENARAENNIFV